MAYEGGFPFDYYFAFSNIPHTKGALGSSAVGKCLLGDNEMLIGETVCWRGEAVFPVQARTRRHTHSPRHTQVGADEGISAYTEVMELSFLASLPESS